eukprot:7996990-Ditylum_brightwellii.AAC.1
MPGRTLFVDWISSKGTRAVVLLSRHYVRRIPTSAAQKQPTTMSSQEKLNNDGIPATGTTLI